MAPQRWETGPGACDDGGVNVQLGTDTTESGGMRLTVSYGPTLLSIIFDPSDEDIVLECIQKGFAEAKAARNGNVLTG